ncbi:MAG: hypothetical protein LLF90_10680 [Methanomicrobiaceae archaeon]|nr:hypothetical protein [Methanomicrobiaceae archaeon]
MPVYQEEHARHCRRREARPGKNHYNLGATHSPGWMASSAPPGVRVFRQTGHARAHRRKLLGNPPKSTGADTIGDELIWETLLLNLEEDLIFITRDRTYRHHTAYLVQEVPGEDRRGGLTITEHISGALKLVGRPPSPALVWFEGGEREAGV